jgi:hypothetical protein
MYYEHYGHDVGGFENPAKQVGDQIRHQRDVEGGLTSKDRNGAGPRF